MTDLTPVQQAGLDVRATYQESDLIYEAYYAAFRSDLDAASSP